MLYPPLRSHLVRVAATAALLLLPCALPAHADPLSGAVHVVQPGETLWAIASAAGVDANALAAANNLSDSDALSVGQSLALPAGTAGVAATPVPRAAARSAMTAYTVQAGETLSQVARRFGVTADAIASANGLDDANRIVVGMVVKVPVPGREHVVQDGESLREIAAQEKVDLGSLVDFNNLVDPDLVRAGQVVLVPVAGQVMAASAAPVAATPAPLPAATQPPTASAPAAGTPTPTATLKLGPSTTPTATGSKPGPKPQGSPAPATVSADGIAGGAAKLLGMRYVWGGSNLSGFDCSGLVWYVARQAGRTIPRGLLGEYNSGGHPGRDELKAGDLVFFQNTYAPGLSHAGVYLGAGKFVSAADEASGVVVSDLSSSYWASHWFGATRL